MARRRGPSATTKMSAGATVEGLNETLKALNRLDKDAKAEARDKVQEISELMAREIRSAGNSRPDRRDQFVASTVRAKRDRLPVLNIGSASKMNVSRAGQGPRASDLVFGMEFGSNGRRSDRATRRGGAPGWRFPERTPRRGRGNEGYWIFPTARAQQRRVVTLWANALDELAIKWGRNG